VNDNINNLPTLKEVEQKLFQELQSVNQNILVALRLIESLNAYFSSLWKQFENVISISLCWDLNEFILSKRYINI